MLVSVGCSTQHQRLRTDAEHHRAVGTAGDRQCEAAGAKNALLDHAFYGVHRRPTDELGDEAARRLAIDPARRVELHQTPFVQHRDPGAERDRLFLIVGNEDEGAAKLAVQALEFGPGLQAKQRVQIGERLVHQADLGLPDQGARDRDPLRLAA